jgi:hypothetical protein
LTIIEIVIVPAMHEYEYGISSLARERS